MAIVPPVMPLEDFASGGEMGKRIKRKDWSATPLGPIESWPQSLRTTVSIMLSSRFAMWMAWGPHLTFFCNDAYLPTVGIKRDWVLGSRSEDVWKEIWPDIGPRIDRVLASGQATWDESLLLFLERSGFTEETYHTFSYSPLRDDAGAISGMLCVVAEVTERVLGERRLALLRDLGGRLAGAQTQADVLDAVEVCLASDTRDVTFALTYLFDENVKHANLVARAGIAADHAVAPSTVAIDDEFSIWPIGAMISANGSIEQTVSDDHMRLPSGAWQIPASRALIVPIVQQGQSRPTGAFVAGLNPFRPLDAAYRAFIDLLVAQIAAGLASASAYEQERRRAEALEQIDRAKTTFFSNVSHELRTPLTLILGPLDDLKQKLHTGTPGSESEVLVGIELAYANAKRLLKLVNTLLDFSRVEAGRMEASFQETDLAIYTAELASVFRSAIEKAGLVLVIDCSPLPDPAYVDRTMWEKIVLNLLSNAFKFTMKGSIRVSVEQADGCFTLKVEDTGIGVPADELPKLFDRFYRVVGAQGRTHEGSGIGLALVRQLVQMHGGEITAESMLGSGTTFTVTIPMSRLQRRPGEASKSSLPTSASQSYVEEALSWLPDETPVSTPLIEHPAPRSGLRERIILADDNSDIRNYLARLLSQRWDVDVVGDGQAALSAAKANPPDLILSDVMMPNLDGFSLIERLRADERLATTPVILLSARAGEEARIEGLERGADDYLTKPFSARELLASVAATLKLAKVRREAEQRVTHILEMTASIGSIKIGG